ncbi:MAG: hypothetical protein J6R71_08765 [Bacteroidales bacterium]|nr:hypothetical protein [Bacteroidales bacterium]
MKKGFTFSYLLLLLLTCGSCCAQETPSFKVDFSISGRNEKEVLEPGFKHWIIHEGKSQETTIDGVTCSVHTEDGKLVAWWNKTYVRDAANAAQNGRLSYDGLTLTSKDYGTFSICLEGLPKGKHRIQTYHNCWENPARFYATPMTVTCNGKVMHSNVVSTFGQAIAANTCILTTEFNVKKKGERICLTFTTSPENAGQAEEGKQAFKSPLCNGFELNTPEILKQAKAPYPTSGDLHADGDEKQILLQWEAANEQVKEHRLYLALSADELASLKKPTAVLPANENQYLLKDIYSMNTYFWRVDEVYTNGKVTPGLVWHFKPRQLAFPGAEGYGRFAQGGRGGIVYHVTNLSSERIPGSFLYGLLDVEGPRTIVFDVSGIIDMKFQAIFVPPYTTIAAQTAPGKGICLQHSNINIGADGICRFVRAKRGFGITGNAMGVAGTDHTIVDHCTATWGTDETVSGRGAKNVSFQYCMIAEPLGITGHTGYPAGKNHGYAATIDGKIGSWHHNLIAHSYGRNFSMGGGMDGTNTAIGQLDIFNNVVYNWCIRTTDGNAHEVNFVNNYYKMGPMSRRTTLFTQQYERAGSAWSVWRAYVSGNVRENLDGSLSPDKQGDTYAIQVSRGAKTPDYETVVDQPFYPSHASIQAAEHAYKIVLSDVGATMPIRDDQHQRIIREVLEGTYTYTGSKTGYSGQIDHEQDAGGFEEYPFMQRPEGYDSDQDGMPDWWEKLIGSNAQKANHNDDPDHDGWTLLEDYLEFLAHPYLLIPAGSQASFDAAICFKGFDKQPVFSINSQSDIFAAEIDNSLIKVNAKEKGLGKIVMKVTDAQGDSFEQTLNIAICE